MVGRAESHEALPPNDNIIIADTITAIVFLVVVCPNHGLGVFPRCFERHDVVGLWQLVGMSSFGGTIIL